MPIPSTSPYTWDPSGAQSTAPTPGRQLVGFIPGVIPRRIVNALFGNIFEWLGWVEESSYDAPTLLWCGGQAEWGKEIPDNFVTPVLMGPNSVTLAATDASPISFYNSWGPVYTRGRINAATVTIPNFTGAGVVADIRFYADDGVDVAELNKLGVTTAASGTTLALDLDADAPIQGWVTFKMIVTLYTPSDPALLTLGRVNLTWDS